LTADVGIYIFGVV